MTWETTHATTNSDPAPKAGNAKHSMTILELTESNDNDMDNGTKPRQQEEEQESNAWRSQNITHIESATQHARTISLITATEGKKRGRQATTER